MANQIWKFLIFFFSSIIIFPAQVHIDRKNKMSTLDEVSFSLESLDCIFKQKKDSSSMKFDIEMLFRSLLTIRGILVPWSRQLLTRKAYGRFLMLLMEYYVLEDVSKSSLFCSYLNAWDVSRFKVGYFPNKDNFPFLDYLYGCSSDENNENAEYYLKKCEQLLHDHVGF